MKSIRVVLLAAFCCCCLASTARLSAQAAPADVLNSVLKGAEDEIVSVAEAMPADKYNFAPTQGEFKGVRTFAQQVKHISEANYFFFAGFGVSGAANRADIEKLTSKEDIVKALRASFAYAHSAISTITTDNALTTDVKDVDGQTTRAGIAAFSASHAMDHFGQMVVYLRMNGVVPPSSR
jgi:uncharacterized damage-inducible protein DinB